MKYKCTNGFTSRANKKYNYGDKISGFEYDALPSHEKSHFKRDEDEDVYTSSSDTPSSGFDFGLNTGFDLGSSLFDSGSSSSTDFGGFGGGDSGGGGASGGW